jgi:hypothetical protein
MSQIKASAEKRKRPTRVFLSHSYDDTVLAHKIRDLLFQRLGLQVFLNADLSAAGNWQPKLRKQLEAADVFVALLTPSSVADSWVLQETGAAWGLQKTIIPLVTRQDILDRFPIQLRSYPALDLKDLDTPAGSKRFAEAIEQTLAAENVLTQFAYHK